MEQILYSEIELICMAVDGLLLYWAARREAKSASDQWLILVLICFFCNFKTITCNFNAGNILFQFLKPAGACIICNNLFRFDIVSIHNAPKNR